MGEHIEERPSRAALYRDLPREPKRPGWKNEFLQSLVDAAKDLGENQIGRVIKSNSRTRRTRHTSVRFPKISPDPNGGPFCLCANQGKSDFPVTMSRKDFPRHLLKPPSYHQPNFRLSSETTHLLLRRLVPHLLLHLPLPIRFAVQHQRHLPL
jgi:hypothetical protein